MCTEKKKRAKTALLGEPFFVRNSALIEALLWHRPEKESPFHPKKRSKTVLFFKVAPF